MHDVELPGGGLALTADVMNVFTALRVKLSPNEELPRKIVYQVMSRRNNRGSTRPLSDVSDGDNSAVLNEPSKRRANVYDAVAGNFSDDKDVIS
jgi:hypothetical protein